MANRSRAAALIVALLALAPAGASAQSDFPNRPVRMIAPAAPGGNPDVLARLLSQKLTQTFGKAFVVENVPGAGGVVAAKMVAATQPDGHVLMFGDSGSLAINYVLNPDLGYDPLKDFTPITALVTLLAYGSAGPGSIHHLTMAIFAAQAGIDLLHVPYRGGTALVGALVKGEVQAGWSGIPNVLPLIEAGQLRVLCISTHERSPSVPNVPTAIELGIKDFDYATMMGLQTSAGTSRELVARLQGAVAKALREPDLTERMATLGMDLRENGTADYVKFMQEDIARYRAAITTFKLQIN
jgi:tripartite-type tricarboxylate transporter receptor subunit TctC